VSDVPLSFSVNDASATTPADFFKRTIYLHESAAGVENDPGNVCLVIGGYRQGEVTPIHYRVDFMSSRGAYLPLLRDHRYLVDVYATEGYGTREEALASKPLDNNSVHVDVIPWDDAWDNNLIIEGELPLLLISNSAFDFDLNGGSREAYLIVNFHGWTVQEKPDWINVSPDGGGIGGIQTFTVTAEALASGSREGYFYLVSGHLKRKITITQQQ
jgi:hypothetical protein